LNQQADNLSHYFPAIPSREIFIFFIALTIINHEIENREHLFFVFNPLVVYVVLVMQQ